MKLWKVRDKLFSIYIGMTCKYISEQSLVMHITIEGSCGIIKKKRVSNYYCEINYFILLFVSKQM